MTNFNLPPLDDFNAWADFWRYKKGFNVIPKKPLVKEPLVEWKDWQNKPIPEELHNHWKFQNMFKNGMAIVSGRVWHRKDLEGWYIAAGDADNGLAIKEITDDLTKFAASTLVEQYPEDDRMHFLMYSIRPIIPKEPDVKRPGIPLIEIKCLKRLLYRTPTPNSEGKHREISGTEELKRLDTFDKCDEFENLINNICKKYNLKYLERADKGKYTKHSSYGESIELDDKRINEIVELIKPHYQLGVKDNIIFGLSGYLYKLNLSLDSCIALVELLSDNERKAITTVEATYEKDRSKVIGYTRLYDILEQVVGEDTTKEILATVQNIVITGSTGGMNQGGSCDVKRRGAEYLSTSINSAEYVYSHRLFGH